MNLFVILAVLATFSVNVAFSRRWKPKHQDTSGELCQSGDGSSYRGFVSKSAKGHRCLKWFARPLNGALKGLGHHNYCRNPDQSLGPWCHVRRGRRTVKEFCNIPRCSTPTKTPPASVDTEMTCGERAERRLHKIVGGSFTPIESHPWVAAIFHRDKFLCGGSLISPCWVLTAAHCFGEIGTTKIRHLSVHLGKNAINNTDADREQSFTVEELIIHQKYDHYSLDNDIALLRIESRNGGCAVKSASARTVCLPPFHTQLPPRFQCSIAGFGMESYPVGRYSQKLKQAEVSLLSRTECESELYYGERITKNMFCAGSPDWSTDACKGDSGGPLVCDLSGRMFLFGVVSWGEGCAEKNKPGVYTQVTKYNKWIAAKTGLSQYTDGVMYPEK
ncbi:putative tissue-type plasminogen activator-like isoform 2 [Scophthalmus maximus]|uniref:trypsin n=1 Tax=Scophthalmus maximus TaxID=52904 RepID=A0A2U9CGT3_SCOMX|nr:putative tissue-type plasminogen activator-like [Scophthalmus maximus]AWP14082.1 putative tissue-type plasminogen activator-like isoform 2 [Scophthalmus maximus]